MDCPVCFMKDDQPKRLSCSHTLCVRCVQSMLDRGGARRQEEHSLRCPICKKITTVPEGLISRLSILSQEQPSVHSANVGAVTIQNEPGVAPSGGSGGDIDWSQSPARIWQKVDIKEGCDVIWTPTGEIIVSDDNACEVLMYTGDGEMVIRSRDNSVQLWHIWGVAYDLLESAIIVCDGWQLTFLKSSDLTLKRKLKLESGEMRSVGLLSDGRLVVGTSNPHTVALHDRQGRKLHQIKYYGQHKVSGPKYLTVLPDDTIVVSMCFNNHVVFLSAELECLQVVDVKYPLGLTQTAGGNVLVVSWGQPRVLYQLCDGEGSSIQKTAVMTFSKKDMWKYGGVRSVSLRTNQLAVLRPRALHFYQCQPVIVTVQIEPRDKQSHADNNEQTVPQGQ